VQGRSSKFWEVAVSGKELTVCYGRIGSKGQQKTKSFADDAQADREAQKLVAQKTKEGHVEKS
jgi:predicted DNA-binding WGR domain protein